MRYVDELALRPRPSAPLATAIMLHLKTFGGLRIAGAVDPRLSADADRVSLGLLAFLAVAGTRGASREEVVAVFWPRETLEGARRALASIVRRLRTTTGAEIVVEDGTRLRLDPSAVASDVAAFEEAVMRRELERAAAVYDGPFLDGFFLRQAPEFEHWTDVTRVEYYRRYTEAIEELALDAERRRDFAAAADWLRRLLAIEPLNARFVVRLGELLAASGKPQAAIAVARTHVALLREELDAPADPAVHSMVERVRDSPGRAAADGGHVAARAERPARDRLEQGEVLLGGRYRIERVLGRGGMAVVYLATDLRHSRFVAVKALDATASSAVRPDRFVREIEMLARLQHPHVLPLYDSGNADIGLFYVMPYVAGGSLRDRLSREQQLPIDEAMRIACEVADALGAAHGERIVHRDIKPENILLWAGHAVVADFGIGKVIDALAASSTSIPGLAVGTPAYVSPEQVACEPEIDGRSDLYSLGVVLYEMLAGAPPFAARSAMATMAMRLVDPVPPLRERRPSVPGALEQVVLKLLARVPDDRFQTATEFIRAAGGYRTGDIAQRTRGDAAETRPAREASGAAGDASGAPGELPSLAVLPFADLSPDPSDEYLSAGITDEVISSLSRLRTIRVAARTSTFAFRDSTADAPTIARRLGVEALLEGSVRRSGNRVRVTAQLIGADGYQVWSERFDRVADDVFTIQEEIARGIVDALEVTLLGAPVRAIGASGTLSAAAYEAYLKGRYWLGKRTAESIRRGIRYFQEAVQHDPRFARAFAGLADACALLAVYGYGAPRDLMPEARTAALRALELDASLADAFASLGRIRSTFDWDWQGSERLFARALALSPRYATAHQWYALDCLIPHGRFAEAIAAVDRARAFEPLSPIINASIGLPLFFGRQYAEAVGAYQRALELDPTFGMTHFFLGQTLVELGRMSDAIAALERAIELVGSTSELLSALGHAYGVAGRQADARGVLAELQRRTSREYVSQCLPAQVYVGLGDHHRAVESLEAAYADRATDLIWIGVRPAFDPLRQLDMFGVLVEAMRLDVGRSSGAQQHRAPAPASEDRVVAP